MFRRLDHALRALHPLVLTLASLVLVVLITLLDHASGEELSLTLLYLAPVGLSAWYVGRGMGLAMAAAAAAAWILDDYLVGHDWELVFARYWNAATVQLGVFLLWAWLLSRLRMVLKREERRARTDALTGVLNGRAFREEAARLSKLALRTSGAISLAYLDIDDFKAVNDAKGHSEGDRLLQAVADALTRSLRDSDVVARLGGDEFGVLLPMTDATGVHAVIERARQHLADAAAAGSWPVGFSIGVVTFPFPPQSADEAVRAADQLMYRVKTGGKNGVAYEVVAGTS